MKEFLLVIVFGLCNLFCVAQKTYLEGVDNVPINSTCEELMRNIARDCHYVGEYYIADFEESPRVHADKAETYVADDVWGHGRAHIYVQCEGERVKRVYVEFPWGDASKLGSEPVSVYTWGAMHVFPIIRDWGSPTEKVKGWDDEYHAAKYYVSESWYRPDGVLVTITCFYKWNRDPYNKERSPLDLDGRQARCEIVYEL